MAKKTVKKSAPVISFGAVPSPYDYRDVPVSAIANVGEAFPKKFFIDTKGLPVWHQMKNGSCVGHAFGKYKQKLDQIETDKVIQLSPRFLYALAKCRDGYTGEGTYPRLVASILKDHGCATEETVPNKSELAHEVYVYNRNERNIPGWNADPKKAWPDAAPYKIGGYAFANPKNINELKATIINFNGAALLMRVGKEWYTNSKGKSSWAEKDVVPLRAPKEIVGGHEVWLYGYEDVTEGGKARTKFYIFNSWSDDWGANGMAYFYHDEYAPWLDEAITMVDLPNNIKDQLKQLPDAKTFRYNFRRDLAVGSRGDDVVALQSALMIAGTFDRDLYSELLQNDELGYYGETTAKALYDYQMKYLVAPLAEIEALQGTKFGPKTRTHINYRFNV